jgi:hypothetical protein
MSGASKMSDNIITGYFEESKTLLKKEYENLVKQIKEMLAECNRKALSKI